MDADAQPAVSERLLVIRDRLRIGCNAERACNLQDRIGLGQLPQPAEQAVRLAAREDEPARAQHPQRLAFEQRQLALLLARCNDGQLGLSSRRGGDADLP